MFVLLPPVNVCPPSPPFLLIFASLPPCSREWGACLEDSPPQVDYSFPQLPPGAMYDASHQCRLAFGAGAVQCHGMQVRAVRAGECSAWSVQSAEECAVRAVRGMVGVRAVRGVVNKK